MVGVAMMWKRGNSCVPQVVIGTSVVDGTRRKAVGVVLARRETRLGLATKWPLR